MYPAKPFDIDFAITTVENIYTHRLASLADEASRAEVMKCIAETLTAVTPQLITSAEQLYNTVWTDIRTNYTQVSLNFIMTSTSEMMMRFRSKRWDNKIVTEFFANTVPISMGDNTAVDSTFKEQVLSNSLKSEESNLFSLFKDNHWYIFIIILTMTSFRRTLVEEAAKAAKTK